IEPLLAEFLIYYDVHKADKTAPYKGIVEVMEQLQKQGIKMAVASNKVEEAMGSLMQYYFPTIRFAIYHGQRQGIPTKPDPQIVYDILEETAITQEETLYVGDTAVDMQTATNAGLRSIGVLWGFRDREELEENDATVIIEKPEELLEWVTFF
ncbi:MAG: HAD family hydrolase, partial [Bacteroidales bacterium]